MFPAEAAAARAIFDSLRIADVAGCPTIGESCREWVFQFCDAIFGAYDHETGRRLIQEFFLMIAKKNSKSTIAAGIMTTALCRNWREEGEFYVLAPTKEVADNCFKPASSMVAKDEELSDLIHVQSHLRLLTHRQTGATLKVIAADSETVSGKKTIGLLVDEVWLFGQRANAADMLREVAGGLASRPEGFIIYLTTQSDKPPAGVFRTKLKYARDVRDGKIVDKTFLPVLYEFPPRMVEVGDHLKPENFHIPNPNLGASVDVVFLERKLRQAEIEGKEEVAGTLAKHLNVEVGLALRSDSWAGAEFWPQQSLEVLTLDAILDRCEVVTVGIDGGGLDDLLGLCVIGRERGTGRWLSWHGAWAHKIALTRRKDIAPRLLDFEKDGDLWIVERPGDDVEAAADIVMRIEERGLLAEHGIGVDAAGIGAIVTELSGRGIDPEKRIVAIGQGYKLNGAIKDTERLLAGGTLWHGGRPLMAWCVGNARVETKGNAILITKQASGSAKIDPLMATFNAVSLMSLNPEARGGFPDDYEPKVW
nr:terminase large subunit [Magnetospirillum aberrantis]